MPDPIYPTGLTEPLKVDPAALADLDDGTAVLTRPIGQEQPVGLLLLVKGRWHAVGTAESYGQKELAADEDALAVLRGENEYWVLPLPSRP